MIWRGVDAAATALETFGHPEAARVRVESDEYRKDLRRGFETMRRHCPLVRLRSGRWVPYYPGRLYRRGRDVGWIRETLEGSVYLLISGLYETQIPTGPKPTRSWTRSSRPARTRAWWNGSRASSPRSSRPARVAGTCLPGQGGKGIPRALTRFATGDSFEAGISRFKRVVRLEAAALQPALCLAPAGPARR